ncbi:MAG: YIP1 family protein [Caulobacterales bacterium]|nr:YIP1 family protein [Caulobacterales bacterium]
MSIVEPGVAPSGLVARVKAILTQPTATWDVIDTEPADIGGLYRSYVIPLAAIPHICSFIGLAVFGVGAFGFSYHPSIIWLAVQTIVGFVLSLAMVYVLSLVIDGLAPTFNATKNQTQALKLAAYAPTASWVAGVFSLYPALAIVGVLGGLYSLFTLYKGLPRLMKAPDDKAGPYFVVVLVVAIVIGLVIGIATSAIGGMGMGAARLGGMSDAGHVSGVVNVPGKGSVDLGQLQAAAARAEAASKQMQSGNAPAATDPELLKGLLPASLGGFTRSEVNAASGGAGGVQGSSADGSYAKGDARIRLEVTDMGAMGALAGMAGAFNVKSTKESATGYEKVGKVDGRLTQESYDSASHHGEYGVMVADRFMVQATGDGVSMDELKAAVGAIPVSRLEGFAKAS